VVVLVGAVILITYVDYELREFVVEVSVPQVLVFPDKVPNGFAHIPI